MGEDYKEGFVSVTFQAKKHAMEHVGYICERRDINRSTWLREAVGSYIYRSYEKLKKEIEEETKEIERRTQKL